MEDRTKTKKPQYLRRAYREIKRLRPHAQLASAICGILSAVTPFVNVIMMAKIVEVLYGTKGVQTIFLYCSITVILNFLFSFARRTASLFIEANFTYLHYFEQHNIDRVLFSLDYKQLEDTEFETLIRKYKESREKKGGQLNYLCWMTQYGTSCILQLGISVFLIIPLLEFSFVKTGESFAGSPYFIIALIGLVAIAAVFIFIFQKAYNKLAMNTSEEEFKIAKTLSYYVDTVSDYKNGKEIRLFDMQGLINDTATNTLLTRGVQLRLKSAKKLGVNTAATAIIGVIVAFGLYVFIGLKGLAHIFDISSLVLYLGSFLMLVQGITGFVGFLTQFVTVTKSVRYYLDILDAAKLECEDEKANKKSVNLSDDFNVEFKNVSFKYDGATEYALKNISLKINNGEKVAIVGQNGSGKTTFIKLLSKIYKDYEGEILLNGVDIKVYNDEEYKKIFSIVFQDFKIFSFTVAQNIAGGDDYDKEKVEDALRKADLYEYVSKLQNGIDTYIGKDFVENGVDFSGGESQKLAIARAFYKNSACLILDEPTASLDPIAEAEFYNKFNQFAKDKTALYISHRLSSCIFCERILVFNGGELEQSGSHLDLIKNKDKKYFELWNTQAKYYI